MELGLLDSIGLGLQSALSLQNLFYCFLGVSFGTLLGVIPGIGPIIAITLLFPITFHIEPTSALIMLAGIFYGANYGGSTASILLNLPGTPANAVTCIEGYQMSRKGRAGVALFMTAIASFIGASVGIILMMLFSNMIAKVALQFGAPEYFSLMLLGLFAASTMSAGDPLKGIAMIVVGAVIGTVGIDINSGAPRLAFGIYPLYDGISLIALSIGVFGIAEIVASIRPMQTEPPAAQKVTLRSMRPTGEDIRRSAAPVARGAAIGTFLGILPGTGATLAAFMSYAAERKATREPERFGNGAIEGIVGPETANNAADQAGFIPTMTLGIPGSATMAIMLGVLMIHGISPGPRLVVDEPELFWGLVMSFWVGNLMLLVLNIPFIGVWVRVLSIPYHYLFPAVLVFVCVGVVSLTLSSFPIWIVLACGVLGYAMRVFDYPPAPLLLGFVVGPMLEDQFRRSMVLSRGNMGLFIERPISASIIVIILAILGWTIFRSIRNARRAANATAA